MLSREVAIKESRINEEITASEVFLIDEKGEALGKVSFDQAMWLAYEKGLDLVEMSANANPPVAKLLDYNKELYRRAKEIRKQKAKQKTVEIKEVRLSLRIGSHDLEVKARRAREFFSEGNKVKVFLFLKGREMAFQPQARALIDSFATLIGGEYETPIKKEGKRFWALLRKK